jgi:exopolysaccharide biosynthesis polyprenyl glycosylphosphotransferase
MAVHVSEGAVALEVPAGTSTDKNRTRRRNTSTRARALTPAVLRRRLMLADASAVLVGLAIAFAVTPLATPLTAAALQSHALLAVAGLPAFAGGAVASRLYRSRANARRINELSNVIKATAYGVGFMVIAAFVIQMDELSRGWILFVTLAVVSTLATERTIARSMFAGLRSAGRISRRIVIVGTDAHAIGLLHLFQRNKSLGYEVVGFVGPDEIGSRGGVSVLGEIADLDALLEAQGASGVVVSPASVPEVEINTITRRLTDRGYHVAISSTLRDIDVTRLLPQNLDGRSMIYVEPVSRDGVHHVAKRAFDIVVATSLLIVTAPVLAAAALAIKVTSRGPVFFRQTRVGRNGEHFTMVKLRSMVVDAEARKADLVALNESDGPLFKISHDPRITTVGRFIRKTSIDELPQLVAVIRGEMSMVGPRPALPSEVAEWDELTRERLRVLPGLTGLWQVSGRSEWSFEQYKRLDLYYVDNWSLMHDLLICLRTVGVVIAGNK